MPDTNTKLGLALSGGGFRAALYHIGTLAALAEAGLLHQVEVLSTVSGGSIIGAYYYLKVKELLEGNRPGAPVPTPQVYLEIVKEIERNFLAAVQKNIRMRLLLNPCKTVRMMLEEEYTRSDRLAELLDCYFFYPLHHACKLPLSQIQIKPREWERYQDKEGEFSASTYNAREDCKIPILTINATCLNTGHPWHFTGSWMGEPARRNRNALEQNPVVVLPQLRFDGAYQKDKEKKKRGENYRRVSDEQLAVMNSITLADAVAASAAVPGLFPPLPIHGLYRNQFNEEIVIELSDGGVYDNLGLDTLIEAQCTHVVVSDGTGQLVDKTLLGTSSPEVVLRSMDVMMERIRGAEYYDLHLRDNDCLKPMCPQVINQSIKALFLHLREDSKAPDGESYPHIPGPVNIRNGLIYRLSNLRTDLDVFSEMEAYTLMYHAYTLARYKLAQATFSPPAKTGLDTQPWHFLDIRDTLKDGVERHRLAEQLQWGENLFFRIFKAAPFMASIVPTLAIVAGALWIYYNWSNTLLSIRYDLQVSSVTLWSLSLVLSLPAFAKVRALAKTTGWLRRIKQAAPVQMTQAIVAILIAIFAVALSILAAIHVTYFNLLIQRKGRLRRKAAVQEIETIEMTGMPEKLPEEQKLR